MVERRWVPDEKQRIWRAVADDDQTVLGRVVSEVDAVQLKAMLDPTDVQDATSILTGLLERYSTPFRSKA